MPSYMTSDIHDNKDTNWRNYVRRVAFAYHDGEAPTPEQIRASSSLDRYTERLEHYKQQLQELEKTSDFALESEERKAHQEAVTAYKTILRERQVRLERYNKVLAELENWQAPEVLEETKKDAMQYLRESISWDCDTSHYETRLQQAANGEWRPRKAAEIRKGREEDLKELIASYAKDAEKAKLEIEKQLAKVAALKAL